MPHVVVYPILSLIDQIEFPSLTSFPLLPFLSLPLSLNCLLSSLPTHCRAVPRTFLALPLCSSLCSLLMRNWGILSLDPCSMTSAPSLSHRTMLCLLSLIHLRCLLGQLRLDLDDSIACYILVIFGFRVRFCLFDFCLFLLLNIESIATGLFWFSLILWCDMQIYAVPHYSWRL